MTFQVTIMFGLRFVRFLATILNIAGLFSLWEIDWNFRFLDSDFFVGLMLYHCLRRWPNIETTLRRCFVFDAFTTVSSMLICSIWKVLLFVSNTQCWFNAEQPSATLAQHWNIIGYRPLYFIWLNVVGAERVKAGLSLLGPYNDWPRFIHGLLPTCTSMCQH